MDILMPELAAAMTEATLARWLVAEGAVVSAGDPLVEVEVEKATIVIEAEAGGTLTDIIVPDGTDDVAVGTLIGRLA